MVKKYIEGETKDERKLRKAKEKAEKLPKVSQDDADDFLRYTAGTRMDDAYGAYSHLLQQPKPTPPLKETDTKNYIVCLKHGVKYSSEYVNTLYNMVKRHTTVPYEFICYTDDVRGIKAEITTERLVENGMHGWWYKPMFFDKNLTQQGNILFFDLDVVIHNNIDKLFLFNPDSFSVCRDFNRSIRPDWKHFNSSVFKLRTGSLDYVYTEFMKNTATNIRRFQGDQDWLYAQVREKKSPYQYWPDKWIRSYKWEMRDRKDLQRIGGYRNFNKKASPEIVQDSCVAVFHGEPHPHQCEDDWVKENWQ